MSKELSIKIKIDADTKEIVAVNGEIVKLKEKTKEASDSFAGLKGKLAAFAGIAATFYSIAKAVGFVVSSGWEYNKQMDAASAKLRAMISASRDYVTESGRVVKGLERAKLISAELSETMDLLKKANAQTAMGMNELIDVYALAKPGMDRYRWSLKDQIEILKLVTNTASNFGISAEELATGIDDLAAGTWDASSGFGKMMKAVGVTKEEFAKAANKVEFLKEKLKETGAAQDTYAVAVSNLGVAWDELTGKITQPIFDIAKEGIKRLTNEINNIDSGSIDSVRDALIYMIKVAVRGGGYILHLWKGVKLVAQIATTAYYEFGYYANVAMQSVSDVMAGVINGSYKNWVKFKNSVKELWHDVVSYATKVWNELIGKFANSDIAKYISKTLGVNFNKLKVDVEPFKPDVAGDIVKAEDFSKGIEYYKRAIVASKNEQYNLYNEILEKGSIKAADEFIEKIDEIAKKTEELKKSAKGIEKLKYKPVNKDAEDKLKKAKKATKDAAKAAKEWAEGLKRAKDRLYEATHTDKELKLKKLKEELKELGKYLKKSDLAKIYESEIRKMQGFTNDFSEDFKSAFNNLFSGDFKGSIEGLLKSLSSKLLNPLATTLSDKVGSWFNSLVGGLDVFGQAGVGALLGFVSKIFDGFGHKLSEAEIKAATGRVDFSDKSLNRLEDIIKKSSNPLLPYSKAMTGYLESLNKNFINIAEAIKGSRSVFDYTGNSYVSTQKSGFLGFSSESRSLISSGIELNNIKLGGSFDGYGYMTEKVQETSFWGLFDDEYIKETKKALDGKIKSELEDILKTGRDMIAKGAEELGFNVKSELEKFSYSLGKIDLKGLSPEEASKRIEDALSEVFSAAIDSTKLNDIVNRYKKMGEASLETLTRIASSYEQANYLFEKIGKKFKDEAAYYANIFDWLTGKITQYTAQMKVLDVVEASGGIDAFAKNFSDFYDNFYSDAEKTAALKKELAESFKALGVEMPKNNGELRALIEGFEITDKASAKTYAELLKLSSSFNTLAEASKKLYEEDLKAAKEKLEYEEKLLEQKKSLADIEKDIENKKKELFEETIESFYNLSNSLKDLANSANDLIESFTLQNRSESYSFAFNLDRLNSLEREFKGYFNEKGLLKDPNSYERVEDVYKSILTVAGNLKSGIDENPYYAGYSENIKALLDGNRDLLLNNSKIMQVELVSESVGLAKDEALKGLWGDYVSNKAGLHTENSFYAYLRAAFDDSEGLSKNKNTKAIEEWIKNLYAAQVEENKLKTKHLDSSFFQPGAKLYEQSKIDFAKATGYTVDSEKFNDLYNTLKAFELKNDREDLKFAKELYANNTEIYSKVKALYEYLPSDIKKAFESVVDEQRESIVDSYRDVFGKYPSIDELNKLYKEITDFKKTHSGAVWSIVNDNGVAKVKFYNRTPPRPVLSNTSDNKESDNYGMWDLFPGLFQTTLGAAGFANGGYTGDMPVDKVAGVVHGQEYVVNAKTTKDLGLNNSAGVFKELLEVSKAIKEELKAIKIENAQMRSELRKIRDLKEEEVA